MRGVAAGQHLAGEQQACRRVSRRRLPPAVSVSRSTRLACGDGRPLHVRPAGRVGRVELGRAGAIEREVRVPGRGAVGDHRHRQAAACVGIVEDLDVEHGGQAAQALRADAQRVDLVVELEAQFLDPVAFGPRVLAARACRSSPSGLPWPAPSPFRRVPPMPMPSMPGGHQPAPIVGTVFSTQSTMESEGLSIDELGLVLGAAALGGELDFDVVCRERGRNARPPACCLWCSCACRPGRRRSRRAACCPGRDRRGARLR